MSSRVFLLLILFFSVAVAFFSFILPRAVIHTDRLFKSTAIRRLDEMISPEKKSIIIDGDPLAVTDPLEAEALSKLRIVAEIEKDNYRQEHLNTISIALKLALSDGQIQLIDTKNCTTCTSATGTTGIDGLTGWVRFRPLPGKEGLSKYLGQLPVDPDNEGVYIYTYYSDGENFELNAVLKSSLFTKMKNDGGNDPNKYEVGTDLTLL